MKGVPMAFSTSLSKLKRGRDATQFWVIGTLKRPKTPHSTVRHVFWHWSPLFFPPSMVAMSKYARRMTCLFMMLNGSAHSWKSCSIEHSTAGFFQSHEFCCQLYLYSNLTEPHLSWLRNIYRVLRSTTVDTKPGANMSNPSRGFNESHNARDEDILLWRDGYFKWNLSRCEVMGGTLMQERCL